MRRCGCAGDIRQQNGDLWCDDADRGCGKGLFRNGNWQGRWCNGNAVRGCERDGSALNWTTGPGFEVEPTLLRPESVQVRVEGQTLCVASPSREDSSSSQGVG